MNEKKMMGIIIIVAVGLSFFWIIGIPIIFSAATGVPLWFLWPLRELSIVPSQEPMAVHVNSTAPMTIGQYILVTVIDGINHTSIEGASVKIVFNGYNYYNTTTGYDGTAQFPYPGATTIIYASKDGYQNAEPIPLPQIPDSWVTIRDYQTITLVLGLFGTWGPVLFVYWKQKPKLPNRRKRK
jgi:hypothetical protein